MKNKATKLKGGGHHPGDEDLLSLLDGELEPRQLEAVRSHLEACWTCRARTEKFQNAINSFVEYRHLVLTPALKRPEKQNDFQARLRTAKLQQEPAKSLFSRWLETFGNSFKLLSPAYIKFGIPLIAAVVIAALLFNQSGVQKVSASELLEKSAIARQEKIDATNQPVVYQKLQVRTKNSKLLDWELWNDAKNSRSKQTISGENPKESISVLQELSEILQKNKMNPQKPLSPESFKSWYSSLTEKTDEITENEIITLKTTNHKISFDGEISQAIIKFRPNDFHPFEQILRVNTNDGEKTFEISEVNFEVVSLKTLQPNFFDEKVVVSNTPHLTPQILPTPSATANTETTPTAETTPLIESNTNSATATTSVIKNSPTTVADSNLEIEVVNLLNQAGADTGEQIEVVRQPNGPVVINGILETDKRKNEILAALNSVQNNPAVKINLKTVDEAVAEQAKNKPKQNKSNNVQLEEREVEGKAFPAEGEVRAYFAKQGGGEEAVRQYVAGVENRSNQAMRYLYALKRLSTQFTLAELKEASPEARAKWLNVIKSHARSYQNEIVALRRELQPIFGGGGEGNVELINSDAEIIAAIERMFAAGASGEKTIKAAFTTSDSKGGNNLRSTQFWNALKQAESLARSLQTVK